ncbi:MAG: hypothetical protein U0167_04595 [bacterium]
MGLLFAALAWVALRLIAPRTDPPPAVARVLETVRVVASPEAGRFEIRQWPEALTEVGLADAGEIRVAGERLEAAVEQANETLAGLAHASTAHIDTLEGGPVGLRLAGTLVAFPAADGVRLRSLVGADADHAFATLTTLSQLLETRLEEPPVLDDLDESVRRREMTRLHREIRDALGETTQDVERAEAEFRSEALEATRRAGGPFLRHGRGVAVEVVLAALLGVLLREVVRRRPGVVDAIVTVPLAPAAALGAVASLAGTRWLPVHPIHGLSTAFVPLALAIGWLTPGALTVLSRLDRLFADEPEPTPVPPPPPPTPAPPRPTASSPPAAPAFPRDPTAERAPFFRRRR